MQDGRLAPCPTSPNCVNSQASDSDKHIAPLPLKGDRAQTQALLVKLLSSAGTGYFYVAKKNPRKTTEKLEFRKFDPVARKHVAFKEAKIK